MSAKTKKTNTKNKQKKQAARSSGQPRDNISRLDYLAILPGLFLCVMTALILLMDIAIPGMMQEQYINYPALFRLTNWAIAACGIIFWILLLRRDGLQAARLDLNHAYVLFFGLFLLWIILSTVANGFDDKVIHGVSYRDLGVFHIFALFLFYLFLSSKLKRDSLRTGLILSFLVTADLVAVCSLVARYTGAIPAFAMKKELSAIFFNGNHYGYFLTMAVLAAAGTFLYQRSRVLQIAGLVSLLLNLLILMFNHSFGCLLAVFSVLFILFVISLLADREHVARLGILLGILAVMALLGLVVFSQVRDETTGVLQDLQEIAAGGDDAGSAGHNRWMLWTLVCGYIHEKPLFGFGCEGISDLMMRAVGRGNPHNEVLTWAAFFGIPAAIFYVLGVFSVFFLWIRRKIWHDPAGISAALAALGYFISSLFGVPMFYTLPFFFVFLGLSLSGKAHR